LTCRTPLAGLALRALRDIQAGQAAVPDAEIALSAAALPLPGHGAW
jgi:hypothetical protein